MSITPYLDEFDADPETKQVSRRTHSRASHPSIQNISGLPQGPAGFLVAG